MIFYKIIDGNLIEIHRILHGARDLESLISGI